MTQPLRIANAQGFWGDAVDAPLGMASAVADLDFLTLDYLAEVSMSILAKQRQRDQAMGYARDFVDVVAALAPLWAAGRTFRVVTNAGGLNPRGCAAACAATLAAAGLADFPIGIVSGDDVLPVVRAAVATDPRTQEFAHLDRHASIAPIVDRMTTANAYIGAAPVAEALRLGARMVISGRVADPSLTVGPCLAHFGWRGDDYDRIAGATITGHLIECGTQVTGGISTDWLTLPDPAHIGYPVAEVAADGTCTITKPPGTGGRVSQWTVKEQLVYEIGDPARYLSPDATVSLLGIEVREVGPDRVSVRGAGGAPPPSTYKVSATYRDGFRATGTLTIFGRDALPKARRCGQIVLQRLKDAGCEPRQSRVECLGGGDVMPIAGNPPRADGMEIVLRISVADDRREVVERFTRELAPLVASGPPGVTGYAEGRPPVREVFGYWPTLIERARVKPVVEIMEGTR